MEEKQIKAEIIQETAGLSYIISPRACKRGSTSACAPTPRAAKRVGRVCCLGGIRGILEYIHRYIYIYNIFYSVLTYLYFPVQAAREALAALQE